MVEDRSYRSVISTVTPVLRLIFSNEVRVESTTQLVTHHRPVQLPLQSPVRQMRQQQWFGPPRYRQYFPE